MIYVGIDEVTIVLQPSKLLLELTKNLDWEVTAEAIISRFEFNSEIKSIMGRKNRCNYPPKGYTKAFSYGEHSFYFAVAYHPLQPTMGCIVKFSAESLRYFTEETQMNVSQLLRKIQNVGYTARLSRVDLFIDYIDEDEIGLNKIHSDLINGNISPVIERINPYSGKIEYRKNSLKLKAISNEGNVETIYLGSQSSASFLRIYEKRLQQLSIKGSQLDRALACKNWIRFEGVFRNHYAHQLTEALIDVKTDVEYFNVITSTMLQKYSFMQLDKGVFQGLTDWTQTIKLLNANKKYVLFTPNNKNFDLASSIAYLLGSSGTITTLIKIYSIWGNEGLNDMLDIIKGFTIESLPNDDCRYWLRKNKKDISKKYKTFSDYYMDTTVPILK